MFGKKIIAYLSLKMSQNSISMKVLYDGAKSLLSLQTQILLDKMIHQN